MRLAGCIALVWLCSMCASSLQTYSPTHKENLRNCLLNASANAILERRFRVLDEFQVKVTARGDLVEVSLETTDLVPIERKMKASMSNTISWLLLPGLFMAGVLPWVLPGLKMVVMTVAMVNQMAFSMALFTLVRSYVFDTDKAEHIVYVNNGYKNSVQR